MMLTCFTEDALHHSTEIRNQSWATCYSGRQLTPDKKERDESCADLIAFLANIKVKQDEAVTNEADTENDKLPVAINSTHCLLVRLLVLSWSFQIKLHARNIRLEELHFSFNYLFPVDKRHRSDCRRIEDICAFVEQK